MEILFRCVCAVVAFAIASCHVFFFYGSELSWFTGVVWATTALFVSWGIYLVADVVSDLRYEARKRADARADARAAARNS